MTSRKKEDRIKSGVSTSPYSRKGKEGTAAGTSSDSRSLKINLWQEWSENEVNMEKWDIGNVKGKEKDKPKTPLQSNLFEDPDNCIMMPPSIQPSTWKRCSDIFTMNPVVVDAENGVHDFDIFSPNEHLLSSETMRWIICELSTLWKTSESYVFKEQETSSMEGIFADSSGKYHTWRFWDHIFSLNKVGKGLPLFNPSGKYIVKLYWMNEWRKIYVDDLVPFDEHDRLLLPVTNRNNEIWPIILSKALLKVASLSYCKIPGDPEFGDFSAIHCLTGWIQQKKIISKQYRDQMWQELNNILPIWDYPETKKPAESLTQSPDNMIPESSPEKIENKEISSKDKSKKDGKDSKSKEKKEREKSKTHTTQDNQIQETKPLVMVTFKSTFSKLMYLTASENADKSESLRKMGISQAHTHPILLNYVRDKPLIRPKTPEQVPSWKLIRPMAKPEIPRVVDNTEQDLLISPKTYGDYSDLFITEMDPIQVVEIQSPFIMKENKNRKFSSTGDSDITYIQEELDEEGSHEFSDIGANLKTTDISKNTDTTQRKDKVSIVSKQVDNSVEEIDGTLQTSNMVPRITTMDNIKENSTIEKEIQSRWMNIKAFCDCFDLLYIYHRPKSFKIQEKFKDKSIMENKDEIFIFTDNIESSEILFSVSCFCRWLIPITNQQCSTPLTKETKPLVEKKLLSTHNSKKCSIEEDMISLTNHNKLKNQMVVLVVEQFSWNNLKVGRCFKQMRTNGTLAISLLLPAGRHCLRVHIQSPGTVQNTGTTGYCCQLVSRQPFSVGSEDEIIQFCTKELAQIHGLANRFFNLLRNWLIEFDDILKRESNEKAIMELVFGKQYDNIYLPAYTKIISQTLLKAIEKSNPDIMTRDMFFSFRCLTLDLDMSNFRTLNSNKQVISNRNSAKNVVTVGSKVDNRKPSSVKNQQPVETKIEEKKVELETKEYSVEEKLAIIKLQSHIRGWYVRRIVNHTRKQLFQANEVTEVASTSPNIDSRQGDTAAPVTPNQRNKSSANQNSNNNKHIPLATRVMADLSKIVQSLFPLNENTVTTASPSGAVLTPLGSNANNPPLEQSLLLLNTLQEQMDQITNCTHQFDRIYNLLHDRTNHIGLLVFSGKTQNSAPGTNTLLFRDVFYIPRTLKSHIIIKLDCTPPVSKCTMVIYDNDTGNLVYEDNITRIILMNNIQPNNQGYTLLGYVNDETCVCWKLKIITDANDTLPKFNSTEINSDFSLWKIKDYFISSETGPLFEQMVSVKENHAVSVSVQLSNPTVPLLVIIMNHDSELCRIEGIGNVFLPSFIFQSEKSNLTDENLEDSNRSPSRTSNKSKKKSAKNSRTDSVSSNEDLSANKYSIKGYVDYTKWSLTNEEIEFTDNIKNARQIEFGDKLVNEQSQKTGQNTESTKKETNQKTANKSKNKDAKNTKGFDKNVKGATTTEISSRPGSSTFDGEKPHWKLYVYSDAKLEDNIKISKNNEFQEQLIKLKKSWRDLDPLRFDKGKQAQLYYLEEIGQISKSQTETKEAEQTVSVETNSQLVNLEIPKVDFSQYYPPPELESRFQDQEERVKLVDNFRKLKLEWDKWFIEEKISRKKHINECIQNGKQMQINVDQKRLNYYRNRENIRKVFEIS